MIGDPKGASKFGTHKFVLEVFGVLTSSLGSFNGDFLSADTFLTVAGLNVPQWLENMKIEHCEVDPHKLESTTWGASDRQWQTRNYGAKKST